MSRYDQAHLLNQIELLKRDRDQWKCLAKRAVTTVGLSALLLLFFAVVAIIDGCFNG